jgi:hypothetical protein
VRADCSISDYAISVAEDVGPGDSMLGKVAWEVRAGKVANVDRDEISACAGGTIWLSGPNSTHKIARTILDEIPHEIAR